MDVEELKVQRRLLQQQLGLVDRRVENAAVLLNRKRAAKPLPAGVETFAEHKKSEQQMVSKGVGNVPDMISAPSPVALGGRIEQIRNRALVHRADQTERRRVRDSKVILPAPSKAGAYRKQTVQPTMFPTRYSRGELPCAIEHDGPARVSDYFRPREVALAEGATGKEATLRVRRASFSHL